LGLPEDLMGLINPLMCHQSTRVWNIGPARAKIGGFRWNILEFARKIDFN
jgi:hypothetical protein